MVTDLSLYIIRPTKYLLTMRRPTSVRRQKSNDCQLSESDCDIKCCLTGRVQQRRVGAVGQQKTNDLHVTLTGR